VVGLGEHLRPEQLVGSVLVVAGLVVTRVGTRPGRTSKQGKEMLPSGALR
jgi:drug/metabolite transporter (DMT)-like permease